MARLLFHAPKYAILDEATSAVSADGERVLYNACVQVGITMLSIGHRPALRDFHSTVLHFEGQEGGKGWRVERLRDRDLDGGGGGSGGGRGGAVGVGIGVGVGVVGQK